MSNKRPEELPRTTNWKKRFPESDISGVVAKPSIEFFNGLSKLPKDRQRQEVARYSGKTLNRWRRVGVNEEVFQDIGFVCDSWGRQAENKGIGPVIASTGAYGMLGLINARPLFPINFKRYSDEMRDTMGEYDMDMIRFFAKESWQTMKNSHPLTYDVLSRPLALMVEYTAADEDPEMRELLIASAALPYLLATTTEIDRDLTRAMSLTPEQLEGELSRKR